METSSLRGGTAANSVGGSVGLSEMDLVSNDDYSRSYPSIKDYYNANADGNEHNKPIQLLPGLSNYSGLVLGDDRITVTESIMSAQMRVTVEDKLAVPSPSKAKSFNLRRKEYQDALERVGDNELNRLERLMKDKLVQRSAKTASSFQVMKAFKFFDRDQCNRISIEGFTRALEFLGFQFSELQNMALFARYDTEYTGDIDYANFIACAMFEATKSTLSPTKGSSLSDDTSFSRVDDFDMAQVKHCRLIKLILSYSTLTKLLCIIFRYLIRCRVFLTLSYRCCKSRKCVVLSPRWTSNGEGASTTQTISSYWC